MTKSELFGTALLCVKLWLCYGIMLYYLHYGLNAVSKQLVVQATDSSVKLYTCILTV